MAFAVRRAGQHRARLSLVILVVALAVAGIGGIDAVAERMLASGASRIFAAAEPAARTVLVVARMSPDADAQDADVRRDISSTFAGMPVVVSRQVVVEAPLAEPADGARALRLIDDDRAADLAVLTRGSWPQKSGQVALPDAAAQRLQLRVGDTIALAVDGGSVALVGTWEAKDPADPAWHGDPAVASGQSDDAIGPAVVAHGALANSLDGQTVTWEVVPAEYDFTAVSGLQRAVADLPSLSDRVDPGRKYGFRIVGNLGDTLQRQSAAVAATRGLLVVPLLIIALLGALVLGIVLNTLSVARQEELVLLRARGASVVHLARSAATESVLVAATGVGLALAVLALSVGITTMALLAAGLALAFPGVVAGVLTLRRVGTAGVGGPGEQRSDAGRPHPALLLSALIALALAGLSGWQLFSTGSPVRADGTPDPLASAAPATMLIAACALAPVAAAPLAAVGERMLRRTRGITPILPLRQIARRMGGTAVAVLCLALAAGSLALAATAPSSASAAEQLTRSALLGGDVRMISADGLDVAAAEAAKWDGVTGAEEVLHTPLTVGSDAATLVSASSEALHLARPLDAAGGGRIRAEITRSLADRLAAGPGTVFTAGIRFVSRPVTFEVARIVDALPGVGSGWGVAVDAEQLRAAGIDLAANELWLDSDTPAATASRLRAHATHPVRILTAAQVSTAPVTSTAPAMLAAGALVSAVLGIIGFIAASSATTRIRRGEAATLRALGLRAPRQRALRIGETTGVAVYALLIGAVLGAGVAMAVLPVVLGVSS